MTDILCGLSLLVATLNTTLIVGMNSNMQRLAANTKGICRWFELWRQKNDE